MQYESKDPVTAALRASTGRLFGVAIFSGIINLLTFSGSIYMLQVYDRVIPSRELATLLGLSVIVLIAYLFQGYFETVRTRMLARIGTLFDLSLQESIHSAIAVLPLRGVSALVAQQPLRDLDHIRAFLSGMGVTAFLDMPWTPLFLIALFVFHPLIGTVAGCGMAAIVAMTWLTERQSQGAAKRAMEASAARQVLADSVRQNAEAIRALGMTKRFSQRWAEANEQYLHDNLQAMDTYAGLGAAAKVLRYILQSAVLGVGAYLVVVEQATGGIIIASSIMMGRALAPIEVALAHWKQLVAARQAIARLRDIFALTDMPASPPVALPRPVRHLAVEALSVKPPGRDRIIVSNVSFAVSAGDGLAVLGASAAGKSSLVRALVGIWPAASGHVRLDNATLDQWQPDELGRHIGYLPQDVCLFDGTVAENIARFEPAPVSRAIIEAARTAGAHEMILRLPEGYATRVGERGMSLSAGQRQRIGLARAVYGEPFLVVLDEPNANLDAEGEGALIQAIRALRRDERIVVTVSHRPNALAALNVAMVLHEGRLVSFGPCEQIVALMQRAAGGVPIGPVQPDGHSARVAHEASR